MGEEEAETGPVESVATDVLFFVPFPRHRVHVCGCGHRSVESGIEDAYVGDVGELALCGGDAEEVGGVVDGCEWCVSLNQGDDFGGDFDGTGDGRAAVDGAVAYDDDLV